MANTALPCRTPRGCPGSPARATTGHSWARAEHFFDMGPISFGPRYRPPPPLASGRPLVRSQGHGDSHASRCESIKTPTLPAVSEDGKDSMSPEHDEHQAFRSHDWTITPDGHSRDACLAFKAHLRAAGA